MKADENPDSPGQGQISKCSVCPSTTSIDLRFLEPPILSSPGVYASSQPSK
ncbi:unnamed protein product [Musa acuminata var. zebrina]